jgi:hypothetical protein
VSIPKATHHGKIGAIDCYVLEDARCVLSKNTAFQHISSTSGSGNFDQYLVNLSKKVGEIAVREVFEFITPDGKRAHAIDDESFANIIAAYVDGLVHGKLHPQQIPVALRAYDLQKTYAKIGLRAHILTIAGVEPRTVVRKVQFFAERLLRREPREWTRVYSRAFVRSICELYGWKQAGDRVPPQMATIFTKLYRMMLGRDGQVALKKRCPDPVHGNNQHQILCDELAAELPSLTSAITYIARKNGRNKDRFWREVEELLGLAPMQTELL